MSKLALTAGDTAPERMTYKDLETGAIINLTGYQSITLRIDYPTTPLTKAAVIDAGTAGTFTFNWITTDLQAGTFPARIIVVDAAGKKRTHLIGDIVITA